MGTAHMPTYTVYNTSIRPVSKMSSIKGPSLLAKRRQLSSQEVRKSRATGLIIVVQRTPVLMATYEALAAAQEVPHP